MSFIYRYVWIYRIIMNILYLGKYKNRFNDITALFEEKDQTIVELCFGDIFIAAHCRKTGRGWTGFDVNASFVGHAVKKGFCAQALDLFTLEVLPQSDVCIMAGSLYHFHDALDKLFALMIGCAPTIIISEPIRNLTSRPGWVGRISASLSNAGKGRETFRFNHDSLIHILEFLKKKHKFKYDIISEGKDILIRITHARTQHRHTDL
jgi:hypothetical protein